MPNARISTPTGIVGQRSPDGTGGRRPVRVAYVTQWFAPEPSNIPLWIATSLRRQGLEVDVITGVPNYPTGKTYPGYSAWRFSREVVDGFPVTRTPLYPSHGQSALGRIVNLASYSLSSTVFGRRNLKKADVALVYSSPATAAAAAMHAHRRFGTPYVLQILDMWPDSVFASGFLTDGMARRAAEKSLNWFVNRAYTRAAHIGVTSPGMRDLLIDRGVPAEKISIIYNWVDEEVMKPTEPDHRIREQLDLHCKFVLMYAGNHGSAQRLDVVIQAMSQLERGDQVHLVMVGDGSEKPTLRKLAQDLDLQSVHFVDQVPAHDMPGLMASADMQLVSLADEALFRITMPSKVQSIMACAQPILLNAAGDAARAVDDAGAGITCPPGQPAQLARAIRAASNLTSQQLTDMGRAGHDYYRAHMSEAVNSQVLADALNAASVVHSHR
jgi:colanic acid biosynthesis glycosyl transferase WcaI